MFGGGEELLLVLEGGGEAGGAEVVALAEEHGGFELGVGSGAGVGGEDAAAEREVFLVELFLEGDGVGGDDELTLLVHRMDDAGEEVGEGFADAGAGLENDRLVVLHRGGHGIRHVLLLGAVLKGKSGVENALGAEQKRGKLRRATRRRRGRQGFLFIAQADHGREERYAERAERKTWISAVRESKWGELLLRSDQSEARRCGANRERLVLMQTTWTALLAEFLREEPGVEAVRLDATGRKVQIATFGEVDLVRLEARIAATLAAIEAQWPAKTRGANRGGGEKEQAPAGFAFSVRNGVTELSRPSCVTAPTFWRWSDITLPAAADVGAVEESLAGEPEEIEDWRELGVFAAACGVLGLAGWATGRWEIGPGWLPISLFLGALIAGGWDAAIDSWANLRKAKLDIHFLMLAVAIGASAIGAWSEAVLLLFLFSASGAMEAYANERTHREVDALLKSAPKQATVVGGDGQEKVVAVEAIKVGDLVRVRPGEAFCADGLVEAGESGADESALTGEAVPVEKALGDQVFSGTINVGGTLDWRVQKLPAESTLQKIIRLIHGAQRLRAPSQRFTDKFGTGYTYAVLGLSAAMFLVWWLGFNLEPWRGTELVPSAFYRAMTLLVVMSPCALVLSIPSAILAAIAWGARHGVLFRGGAALEKLAEINVIALDKTGTLTTGELVVQGYESFPPGRENEVMALVYALEARSEHPLARAIVRDARARGVREAVIEGFESITGQGVRARVGGATVMLGRRELLERGPLKGWAEKLPSAAAEFAEVWLVGPGYIGRVLLKDAIRRESAPVLANLKKRGIRTVMLTGDRRATAEAVGAELGLEEVRAGLTPEEKVAAITALKEGGKFRVAMVGDGVNDAPCLAAADVSLAMGARGSDAALEQAEIVLMNDRIENVYSAYELSRRARNVVRQNLAISLGVVGVMALATILTRVPLALGVAAHEGSTVLVCLNSLRLLFQRGK